MRVFINVYMRGLVDKIVNFDSRLSYEYLPKRTYMFIPASDIEIYIKDIMKTCREIHYYNNDDLRKLEDLIVRYIENNSEITIERR